MKLQKAISSQYSFSKIDKIVARVACYYYQMYEKKYGCLFSFCSTSNDREFVLAVIVKRPCGYIPLPREFRCKNITVCVRPDKDLSFSVEGLVKFKDILKVYNRLLGKGLINGIKKWNYVRVTSNY